MKAPILPYSSNPQVDFIPRRRRRHFLDDQSINLGVLRLLQPVMLQQALELRIELLIVAYAVDVMPQRYPLNMQDCEPDAQRTVRQHEAFDIFRRTDELTLAAKARGEVIAKPFE